MQETNDGINRLLLKYGWKEPLTATELSDLHSIQAKSSYHQALPDQFRDIAWVQEGLREMQQFPEEEIWQRVMKRIEKDEASVSATPLWWPRRTWAFTAAAILLPVFFWVGWQYFGKRSPLPSVPDRIIASPAKKGSRLPEEYRVLLTLADSNMVVLDNIPVNRQVASQGNINIFKFANNSLVYHGISDATTSPGYNYIDTRKTDPFDILLPDGSKIKLSYATSIKYPVGFKKEIREVTLNGEAYFEIAADSKRPFMVNANGMKIQVLGTHFNVKAYEGESINTVSVFDGSVKVLRSGDSAVLNYFEQARVTSQELRKEKIKDSTVVMAWNDSKPAFSFANTDLLTAIGEIGRWHRKKIYNPEGIKGITVKGRFPHDEPLSDILESIQQLENGYAFLKSNPDTIFISATRQAD